MKRALFTVIFSMFILSGFAQDGNIVRQEFYENGSVKLQFTQVDKNLVQAVYFHDNGLVAQKGYYLNEKLYGYWETFDYDENKIASGFFDNNQKTGTWNFWENGNLIGIVSYANNQVASLN